MNHLKRNVEQPATFENNESRERLSLAIYLAPVESRNRIVSQNTVPSYHPFLPKPKIRQSYKQP